MHVAKNQGIFMHISPDSVKTDDQLQRMSGFPDIFLR